MVKADLIARGLAILYLVKPTIDLLWDKALFSLGGRAISPLHLTAIFVFFYFGRFLFQYMRDSAPYAGWFKLFLLLNFVSIAVTAFSDPVPPIKIINLGMRVVISYVIFNAAYLAARYGEIDFQISLLRAISIGTAVTLLFNLAAIVLGYGGEKMGSNQSLRATGLYHDSGTLANVSLYNIMFTAVFLHQLKRKTPLWLAYGAFTIVVSFYLIYIGLSRVVFVEFFVFGLLYVAFLKKGVKKLVPIGFFAILVLGGMMAGLDYSKYAQRFESEIEVLDQSTDVQTRQDKDVDLGRFERFGSNRGQLAAYALDYILKQDMLHLMLGDYNWGSAHSDYIDVLGRNGLVGLVVYLILIFSICRYAYKLVRKTSKPEPSALHVLAFILIVLYILYSFPFRPLNLTTVAWFMWGTLGYAFGLFERRQPPAHADSVDTNTGNENRPAIRKSRRLLNPVEKRGGR